MFEFLQRFPLSVFLEFCNGLGDLRIFSIAIFFYFPMLHIVDSGHGTFLCPQFCGNEDTRVPVRSASSQTIASSGNTSLVFCAWSNYACAWSPSVSSTWYYLMFWLTNHIYWLYVLLLLFPAIFSGFSSEVIWNKVVFDVNCKRSIFYMYFLWDWSLWSYKLIYFYI